MPTPIIAAVDLLKRSEAGAALTASQFDNNYQAIQDALNSLANILGIPIKPDGTLNPGAITTAASFANSIITLAKLASLGEDGARKILRANAEGVIGAEDLPTFDSRKVSLSVQVASTGIISDLPIVSFVFNDVDNPLPAGDIMVWLILAARRNTGSNGGTVTLKNGTTTVCNAPTSVVDLGASSQWVTIPLMGRIPGHAGGDLTLDLVFETGESTSDIQFGVDGDGRFGQSLMILSGL